MDNKRKSVKPTTFRSNKMCRDLSEIMREDTLPYLPAKSLLRFRTVCRDWKHQISGPFFTHSQSNSCRSALGLFYQPQGKPPSFISMDPNSCGVPDPSLSFLPVPVDIKSSSNGLLCCQAQAGDKAYYVCNPVLQQWKKLPKSNADHGSHPEVVLVFEPSLLNFKADYMVFCGFPSNEFDDATEFEIYSSKDGAWKHSAEIRFDKCRLKAGSYANGIVYWWINNGILAHDVASDKAKEIIRSHPSYGNYSGTTTHVTLGTTTNGKACLATCQKVAVTLHVLSTDSSKNIDSSGYSRYGKEAVSITMDMSDFAVTSINNVIAVTSHFVVVQSGGRLYSYNMKTKEVKAMPDVVEHGIHTWLPYVNTFASLEFQ